MRKTADAIAEDLLRYMRDNPGSSMKQLSAGMGRAETTIWMRLHVLIKTGRAWKAGPLHVRRYFADQAAAEAAHVVLVEQVRRQREETRRVVDARYNQARAQRRKEERAIMQAAKPKKPKAPKKYVRIGRAAPYAELDAKIEALAKRPEGFQTEELSFDYKRDKISDRCKFLRDRDRLFAARTGHRTVRYFATKEAADRYVSVTPVALTPTGKTKWASDEADYSRAKITVIPHQPGRFEANIQRGKGQISADWLNRRLSAASC